MLRVVVLVAGVAAVGACSSAADRAQAYYQSGVDYQTKGDAVRAALQFRNALRLRADFSDARLGLAAVEEQQGNYLDAATDYNAVAERDPKNLAARVRLANLLLAANQLDDATKFAAQAAAIAPDDVTVLTVQAAIALKASRPADAISLAQRALSKAPGNPDALMVLASERLIAGDPPGALHYLDQAGTQAERNVGLQIMRLIAFEGAGDQPEVEQLFKKLIDLFPDNPAFNRGLVRWYMSKGRTADAENQLRAVAAAKPSDDEAQLNLVAFVNTQRGATAAIAELNNMITARKAAAGDAFKLQLTVAQVQFASGDKSAALEAMDTLVAQTQNGTEKNQARLEWARMLLSGQDVGQAKALVDAVLANDGGNVQALALRAALYLQQNNSADAIEDLLAALNQAPEDVSLHASLAAAYDRNGQPSLAEEQYGKAMDLSHASPQTSLAYARFLLRVGKVDPAERVLETALAASPNDPDVLRQMAQVKLTQGDWAGAQQIAETLQKAPKQELTASQIAAAAFAGQSEFSKSIDLLQAAIAGSSDLQSKQQVLPDLIATYIRAGKLSEAEAYLLDLSTKDSADVEVSILLAGVYATEGKIPLAEQTLKSAVAHDQGVSAALTLAHFYMQQNRLQDAETLAKAAVDREPTSAAAKLLLGAIYEQSTQFDKAITIYDLLLHDDPSSDVAANNLASLLSEWRDDKASRDRAYDVAQRLSGSRIPQYMDTLGWLDHLRGDYAGALPLLKGAAEQLPNVAMVQYHLGMTLAQLGQSGAARTSLEKALSLQPPLFGPAEAEAKQALESLKGSDAAPGKNG